MTDTDLPPGPEPPAVSWRGRLQRRMRRDRDAATRHALLGVLVSALAVVALGTVPAGTAGAAAGHAPQPAAAEAETRFVAAMVGDVMFARHVERVMAEHGPDALLARAAPLLDGDYVSANLETVLSDRDDLPEAGKLMHFRSPTSVAAALADAGVTTISLANNHTMDHGIPGLRDTIDALDAAGLEHAGAGLDLAEARAINLQEHGGLTVATLSFTDVYVDGFVARAFQGGVLHADPDVIAPLIQRARAEADLVIAHVHWGEEYDLRVRSRQRELAEVAAAAGADLVVGHHPHVLLPVERIGSTVVFYSLGNFVFDQGWSRTRETAIARYVLGGDGVARIELVPTYIREATPRPLADGLVDRYRRARIFQRLAGAGLEWRREDGRLVTEVDHRHVVGDDAPAGAGALP